MKQKYYVVDAFADKVFEGNPAGVCILEEWLPKETMQSIAQENNLSETSFAVREGESYGLRWFTPVEELALVGHATLAAAYVIANHYDADLNPVVFNTLSGALTVSKKGELYELDFPAYDLKPVEVTPAMEEALGMKVQEAYLGRDLLCIVDNQELVIKAAPNSGKIFNLPLGLGCHITAKGAEAGQFDCVSRSFFPKLTVNEDPVCGSAHCHIIPYWSGKLGQRELTARQASPRGGTLYCKFANGRVFMAGRAAPYLEGCINY